MAQSISTRQRQLEDVNNLVKNGGGGGCVESRALAGSGEDMWTTRHPNSTQAAGPATETSLCQQSHSSSPVSEFPARARAHCKDSGNVQSPNRLSLKRTGCQPLARTQRAGSHRKKGWLLQMVGGAWANPPGPV